MNITSYPKILSFLAIIFLLFSCTEEGVLGTGSGGAGGATNLGGGIVLKSDILPDLTIGLFIGDPINPIVTRDSNILYLATLAGLTELDAIGDADNIAISTNGTTLVNAKQGGGIDIITPATGIITAIGSSFVFITTTDGAKITADGSLIAFVTSSDLTGGNPGGFFQIFTLTTDGIDTITQVTNFTSSSELANTNLALSGNGLTLFFHSVFDVMNDGSNADGSDELFSINTDGTNLKQITNNVASNDMIIEMETDNTGSRIAFLRVDLSTTPTTYSLYSVNTSTNVSVFISEIKMTGWGPLEENILDQFDISSDGSKIYYVTDVNSLTKIYSVDSDGSNNFMAFNTGATVTKGIHSSATGDAVTFITDGEYGLTGSTGMAVYTLTP